MDPVVTCASCGGNPDAVIKKQREMLEAATKRAMFAESQLELLRESNKSLEKRVDWADRLSEYLHNLERGRPDAVFVMRARTHISLLYGIYEWVARGANGTVLPDHVDDAIKKIASETDFNLHSLFNADGTLR